ncbi:MAG TPA: hypothetical protein VID50_00745, partial [Candidatus Eisenbacteria bacterium]
MNPKTDLAPPSASAGTPAIHESILTTLGNTPLVRLSKITAGCRAEVLAKVEFFNPGGSVKDR